MQISYQKKLIMKSVKTNKDIYIITGVAGFIGSQLVPLLIKKKNSIVIGIDNLKLGKIKFIEKYIKNKQLLFFNIDLGKKIKNNKIHKMLKNNKLKQIWHLAANSDIKAGIDNLNLDLKDTFLSTVNICDFIKPFIKKRTIVIFSSSSAIYGKVNKSISENTSPCIPESYYGSMKQSSEAFLSAFSFNNNIKSFVFRFPNVVGKNLTHGIIYDLSQKILSKSRYLNVLGNGQQCKPYSNVNEIIRCMDYVVKKRHTNNVNYYNIGTSDKGLKVKNIVNLLLKKYTCNKKVIYEANFFGWKGDIPRYRYSTKKLNK